MSGEFPLSIRITHTQKYILSPNQNANKMYE